jgi:hypothetical protein
VIVPKVEGDDDSGDNASGDSSAVNEVVVWYRVKGSSTISNMDDNGGIDSVFSQVDDIDGDVDTDSDEVDNDEQISILPINNCIHDDDDPVNEVDTDEVNTDHDEKDEEIDNPVDDEEEEEVVEEEEEEEEEEDSEVVVCSTVDLMHRPETIDSGSKKFIDRKLIIILSVLSVIFCVLVGRLLIPPHLIGRNNISSDVIQLPVALINTTSQKPVTLITTTVTIAPNFNANRDSHNIAALRKTNYLFTEIWRIVTNLFKRK